MHLDAHTLLIVTAFITAVVGIIIALTWARLPKTKALLWWAMSFLIATSGTILLLLHESLDGFFSIDVSHMLLILSAGFVLAGARVFNGRTPNIVATVAGAAVWMALIVTVGEHFTFADRVLVAGLVGAVYYAFCGWELWSDSSEVNFSRRTAAIFLLLHAGFLLVRLPVPMVDPRLSVNDALDAPRFTFAIFEALIYSIGLAFLLLAMTLERGELMMKKLALTDPLTGVENRRAVETIAAKIIARAARAGRPVAILAFDLDFFKRVNDKFGHDFGDRVLQTFAETARATLRPSDIFGRMGGEEFTAVLPDTTIEQAMEIAERVRQRFAAEGCEIDGRSIGMTTSVGVAASALASMTFAGLEKQADRALYKAKSDGRNVVCSNPPEPVISLSTVVATAG